MAMDAGTSSATNGSHAESKTLELAIGLPQSPGTRIHLRLTILASSIMLFLTSAHAETTPSVVSMGSLVYGMPDRYNPTQPICTTLYGSASSLDFATRMAKVLARRLEMPCYVGSSVNLSGAAGGGTIEEEMEAFRSVVEVIAAEVPR